MSLKPCKYGYGCHVPESGTKCPPAEAVLRISEYGFFSYWGPERRRACQQIAASVAKGEDWKEALEREFGRVRWRQKVRDHQRAKAKS